MRRRFTVASRVNNRAAAALVARSGPSAVAGFPVDAPGGPGGGGGHVGDDADSTTGRPRDRPPGWQARCGRPVVATSRGGAGTVPVMRGGPWAGTRPSGSRVARL